MRVQYIVILALLLMAGCGRGSGVERSVVSGTVNFQGRPVADGMIRFVPIEGTKGPPTGAVIKDGHYEVKASGGATAGVCKVEIRGFRQSTAHGLQAGGPQVNLKPAGKVQFIPRHYNTNSTLQTTIEAKAEQVQNFDLK